MEASEANQAEPQAPESEATPDPHAPVIDRINELQSGFEGRLGSIEERLSQPQQKEAEQPAEEPGYLYDETGQPYDQYGRPVDEQELMPDPEQEWQQREQQLMQRFEQRIAPLQQAQLQQDIERLESKYPDLQKEETASAVFQAATQRAEAYGNPELARNPQFIEETFLAQRAREMAQSETPAGAEQEVPLESSGASPGEPEEDIGDRIVQASKAHSMGAFFDS